MLPCILTLGVSCAQQSIAAEPVKKAPSESKPKIALHPGQVWSYKTRPEDAGSTVTVFKMEDVGVKHVVHIRLDGLHIAIPDHPGKFLKIVADVPIEQTALEQSVVKLLHSDVKIPEDSLRGYQNWRKAH
ncbi:MAG: hypothetical protein ACRD3W_24285, partial [Terriglobales bacterium]